MRFRIEGLQDFYIDDACFGFLAVAGEDTLKFGRK